MIQDQEIMKAVSRILQRSERQIDMDKLIASFVDIGIVPQLNNANNQIFYGRRGTGKTHVLKVLESQLNAEKENTVVYIDVRTIGSTAQFSDSSVPLRNRCLALFRDILTPIHDVLLERIIEEPTENGERALQASDRLASSIIEPTPIYNQGTISEVRSQEQGGKTEGGIEFDTSPKIKLKLGAASEKISTSRTETSYDFKHDDKVIFPTLNTALKETLDYANTNLFILLDEWASLPRDIQPYLAEFIKRGILTVPRAVLKIASLEYRSSFALLNNAVPPIGFELGADIATAPDLDDYYVYDRNPEQLVKTYADILLRHLAIGLPDDYLRTHYQITGGDDLSSRMFTERPTFQELARACEGVVRDLINIFTLAFFHSNRRGRDSIDKKSIIEASRQWFEQDKAQHLDETMQNTLRKIIDEVIGKRKARSFLLQRDLEKHPIIQKLFDARVIHHMQRGYADKDNPGIRYNIYTLDYGSYVDLLGTSKQPQIDLIECEGEKDTIVPFDDKRSIRRIILKKDILD